MVENDNMSISLAEMLDKDDFEKIIEYAMKNKDDEFDVIGQKKLINYCIKRGANTDTIKKWISVFLHSDNYRKAEPFMEYANFDTLLIQSVEANWPDGINYAIRNGAKNFEFAIYKAIQTNNHNLVEYLRAKIK